MSRKSNKGKKKGKRTRKQKPIMMVGCSKKKSRVKTILVAQNVDQIVIVGLNVIVNILVQEHVI